jgi:hypothetical protein
LDAARSLLDGTIAALRSELTTRGFALLSPFDGEVERLLAFARALGPLYVPNNVDPFVPVIETRPAEGASHLAPFDQAASIGWHNDFSTHEHRAAVSFSYLARPDPCGADLGAWRVASSEDVIGALRATVGGPAVIECLLAKELPFSFTGEDDPVFFRVLEECRSASGRLGLRFYGRALRDGARLVHGEIPPEVEHVVSAIERAADRVGRTLAAPAGSLLVTHNWHALHDRLSQTVAPGLQLRRSLLFFVESMDKTRDGGTPGTPHCGGLGLG